MDTFNVQAGQGSYDTIEMQSHSASPDSDPTASSQDGSVAYYILVPDTKDGPGHETPEPGTWLLLACTGGFGAAVRRRRRKWTRDDETGYAVMGCDRRASSGGDEA